MMGIKAISIASGVLALLGAQVIHAQAQNPEARHAATTAHDVHIELNTLEGTDTQCRTTFVIENKSAALDSLKLDLVVFNADNVVSRRLLVEFGPIRAGRTMVKTFAIDAKCAQIGAVLVNDISACVPGDPNACLDGLTLTSRVNNVRLYK